MYCSNCGKENLWCSPVQSINIIVAIIIVAVLLIILVYTV